MMLFRKKENVKLSRLRMLDGGNGGEKIPGRLALGLVAPFLIVAIFLWVFYKQALSPQPKTVPSDIPPAVVDTVPPVTEGKGTPASPAGDKTEKPVVETPQPVSQPINKPPPVPPEPPVKVASKKPVDKGAVVSSPPPQKKEKKVVATPPKKEPHRPPEKAIKKNETERVIPKVEPVVIKKGRPRSPLEKEPSAGKSKPPVPSSPAPPVSKPLSTPTAPSDPPAPPAPPTPPTSPSPTSPPVPPVPKVPQKRGGGQGSYTIQMGAFPNKEDAERLAFRFKERGYDVYIVFAEIPGKGIWHRVRIGHYADRTLAEKEAEKISNAEHLPFFITPD